MLIEAIDHPIADSQLYYIFQEVIKYTRYHFKTEEYFLTKFKCNPIQTQIHVLEHNRFKDEVATFYGQLKTNKSEAGYNLLDILENWLIHHIPTIDAKYVDCFHKNNLF